MSCAARRSNDQNLIEQVERGAVHPVGGISGERRARMMAADDRVNRHAQRNAKTNERRLNLDARLAASIGAFNFAAAGWLAIVSVAAIARILAAVLRIMPVNVVAVDHRSERLASLGGIGFLF